MAKYVSTNNEVRYYPTLGVEVAPEEVVDLPDSVDAAGLVSLDEKKVKTVTADLTKAADASAEGVSA